MNKSVCSLSAKQIEIEKGKIKRKNKTKKRYSITASQTKHFLEKLKEETENKERVIPLNIFQIWDDKKTMPDSVKKSIELIKEQNPEFTHYFLDLPECREFLKKNFSKSILNAYDAVIPYALKADIARYCLLYKYGGIYLDSKYYGINDFKLIYLTTKEYFCRDVDISFDGIYNAFIICKPKNAVLKKTIHQFVENTKKKYYGPVPLCIGPLMMKDFFTKQQLSKFELVHEYTNNTNRYISYNKHRILKVNEDYYKEKRLKKIYWATLWENREMYK